MKHYILLILVLFVIFISGCATQKAWVYTPNRYTNIQVVSDKTTIVMPFVDLRENINKNRILIYMIPILPGFGWADYNVPEGMPMHITSGLWTNYKPTEDFPKALAQELESAEIFKEVYFDFKKGNSDLILKGKILSTKYKGTIISYGLSVYGPLLWLIGLPAGTVYNELSIEMSCVDVATDKILFSKTYTAPCYRKVAWIYVMPDDFNYPVMIKDLYKEFVEDLRVALKK